MASDFPDFPDDYASLNQACIKADIQDKYIRQVHSLFSLDYTIDYGAGRCTQARRLMVKMQKIE